MIGTRGSAKGRALLAGVGARYYVTGSAILILAVQVGVSVSQASNPFAPAGEYTRAFADSTEDLCEPVPLEVTAILGRAWALLGEHPSLIISACLLAVAPAFASGLARAAIILSLGQSDQGLSALLRMGLQLASAPITLFLSGTDQIPRLQPDSCYNLAHGCGPRLARGGRRG